MIECIKTGCHCHLEPHDEWLIGDAFQTLDGVLIVKCNHRSREPLRDVKHFTLHTWEFDWQFRAKNSDTEFTIMICDNQHYTNHGYQGIPI